MKVWLQSNYLVRLKREIAAAVSRACLTRRTQLVATTWDGQVSRNNQRNPVPIAARGVWFREDWDFTQDVFV